MAYLGFSEGLTAGEGASRGNIEVRVAEVRGLKGSERRMRASWRGHGRASSPHQQEELGKYCKRPRGTRGWSSGTLMYHNINVTVGLRRI